MRPVDPHAMDTRSTKVTEPMQATSQLVNEHQVILRVLECLERMARAADARGTLDTASAGEALDFFSTFADRCHHGKEESVLFPTLEKKGLPQNVGPIAVMLADHEAGRDLVRSMKRSLADAKTSAPDNVKAFARAAHQYVGHLRDHIAKENEVLFPMAEGMLGEDGTRDVLRGFERVEHSDMESGAHERYLALAEGLCSRFGVEATASVQHGGGCCGHTPHRCGD